MKLIDQYAAGLALLCDVVANLSSEQLDATPIPGKWSTRQASLRCSTLKRLADFRFIEIELFGIAVTTTLQSTDSSKVIVSITRLRPQYFDETSPCQRWLPELAPTAELLEHFAGEKIDWCEFARRYSQELRGHAKECQQLRSLACRDDIVLCSNAIDPQFSVESGLAEHLKQLECEDRWSRGLMIGGYVSPVRDEIIRAGGLYFARHKAWMMPSRDAWQRIQSLLPGDF